MEGGEGDRHSDGRIMKNRGVIYGQRMAGAGWGVETDEDVDGGRERGGGWRGNRKEMVDDK